MKKLLFFSFLFITFYSQAQWNPTGSRTRFVPGIALGTRDTAWYSGLDTAIVVMHKDSVVYYKYKGWFKPLGGGGGGTTTNPLTLGSGLLGTSFNGSSAVTAKVDTSLISTKANVTASLLGYAPNALVVKYTDTASMLSAYYNQTATTSRLALKVNYTDTSGMLGNYIRTQNWGLLKTGQGIGADSSLLSTKANVTALLTGYASGASVVKYTDTAAMLSTHPNTTLVNSLNALNVKYTDTASMLSTHPNLTYVTANLATKLNTSDSTIANRVTSDRNFVNASLPLKVNYTDTSLMLTPYIRTANWGTIKTSQALGVDSSLLSTKANVTASLLGYAANALVVKYTDTASMLSTHPNTTLVNSLNALNTKYTDTSTMLTPYVRTANWGTIKTGQALGVDTSALSTKANVTALLTGYTAGALVVKYSDTASMLSTHPNLTYITSNLATKLNVTDSVLANRITADRNFVNASLPLKLNISDTALVGGTNYYNKTYIDANLATKGTVSSVSQTVPAFLSVSGSPITGSGTLAISYSGTALPIANGGTGVTSVTSTPTASAFAGWDANKNFTANNQIASSTSIATAAGTTTLTVASTQIQNFTGTTTQTVVLPVVTTLSNGFQFTIFNNSTGVVTVNTSGANLVASMAAGTTLQLTCVNVSGGTGVASWAWQYLVEGATSTPPTTITLSGAVTGTGTATIATTLASAIVGITNLAATGTPSSTTYLRGDNTWATPGGGGTVTSVAINNASGLTGTTPITGSGTIGADTTILSTKANVTAKLIGYAPLVSPSFTTPSLGVATATSINGNTLTTGSSTYTGTAAATYTFPTATKTIAANDGSNWTIASQAIGDLAYATSTTAYGRLADVAVGSYLRSGGVGTAPLWSTLILPNAATTGDLMYASATNTITSLADVAVGKALISGGVGVAPSWGTVPTAAGGTNLTTFTSGGAVYASSTSVLTTGTLPIASGGTAVTAVTTAPTATSFAGWDANKNLSANNHLAGYTTTATAAGTTTLVVGSTFQQVFTGTTTQTVTLPVATTLVNGQQFLIVNNSTGVVTVQTSGANTVVAMASNTQLLMTLINTAGGTSTASWDWTYSSVNNTTIAGGGTTTNALTMNNGGAGAASGTTFNGSAAQTISYNTIGASPLAGSASLTTTGTITSGTWNGTTIAVANGGTGATTLTGLVKGNGTSAFTAAVAGTDYQAVINGTGFVKATGTTISYDNSTYLTTTTAGTTYVPYTGATGAVNLGTNTLASGTITVNSSSGIINSTNQGTAASYLSLVNTGGTTYLARENSSGSGFGATAYSTVLNSGGAYPLEFWVNGAKQMYLPSTGGLVVGTTINSGAITSSSSVTAYSFQNTSQIAMLLNNTGNNDFRFNNTSNHFRIVNTANTTALFDVNDAGATTFSNDVTLSGAAGTRTLNIQTNTSGNPQLQFTSAGVDGATILHDRTLNQLVFKMSALSDMLHFTSSGNATFGYAATFNSTINTSSTAASNSTVASNSIYTSGGIGVTGASYFASTINVASSVTASSLIKSGGTSSQFLMADGSVNTTSTTTSASGQYTPTISNTTNVASNTQQGATYLRVGNAVTVSGYMSVASTAASTPTNFSISLPVASTLSSGAKDGNGVFAATSGTSIYTQGGIAVSGGSLYFSFTPTSTSTFALEYHFTYYID